MWRTLSRRCYATLPKRNKELERARLGNLAENRECAKRDPVGRGAAAFSLRGLPPSILPFLLVATFFCDTFCSLAFSAGNPLGSGSYALRVVAFRETARCDLEAASHDRAYSFPHPGDASSPAGRAPRRGPSHVLRQPPRERSDGVGNRQRRPARTRGRYTLRLRRRDRRHRRDHAALERCIAAGQLRPPASRREAGDRRGRLRSGRDLGSGRRRVVFRAGQ